MANENEVFEVDSYSFQLGMINCFVEMVACGVKRMAISPPLVPHDCDRILAASDVIVKEFGMQSYLEKSLLVTDLQSEGFTKGKWSVLYFKEDATLEAYHDLKSRQQQLEAADQYDELARKKLSSDFMRLLSYPEDVIEAKLSLATPTDPFVLTENRERS